MQLKVYNTEKFDRTKLWYAIVDGKYYRIKIEDGKVKIEKTETANPTGTGTTASARATRAFRGAANRISGRKDLNEKA